MMDNPYPICENCIFIDEPLDKDPCQECNRAFLAQRIKPNFVSKRKPKTNADRIRAMTDKELAEFIESIAPAKGWTWWLDNGTWLDWLKKENEAYYEQQMEKYLEGLNERQRESPRTL